ncbi:hypothetical protein CFIO01_07121 [Colletotrichum fioriniae PJ7]|uniref:Uncharacterized protein n=1 Tax=Colletotrichum fioriniae PJ7 TaxID=1445577 RepID=A0A010SFZ0_9PEZI|nr:hypothetical protein CFIO01_07121 [Colletotrichum fioriniae PJ7]
MAELANDNGKKGTHRFQHVCTPTTEIKDIVLVAVQWPLSVASVVPHRKLARDTRKYRSEMSPCHEINSRAKDFMVDERERNVPVLLDRAIAFTLPAQRGITREATPISIGTTTLVPHGKETPAALARTTNKRIPRRCPPILVVASNAYRQRLRIPRVAVAAGAVASPCTPNRGLSSYPLHDHLHTLPHRRP